MKKERNSNIEMLRIISILMVVISHYFVHNGIDNSLLPLGINRFLLESMSLGNIGVIIFVMITGYFMSENKKSVRLEKLLILYLQVLFYSVVFYLIFVLFDYETFSIKSLVKYMLPFTFHQYWFVTVYIILYVLSPFINRMLDNLTRKEYLIFLLISLFIFSFMQTFTLMNFHGNELVQFILFYSLGGYFKKYSDNIFSKNRKFNYFVWIISIILLLSSIVLIDNLQVRYGFSLINSTYFFNRHSIIAILFSVALFNLFANKKVYSSKIINTISSLAFGIYLLSDHNIVRKFIWIDLFKNANYVNSNYLILHFIITIFIILIVCSVVEFIRKNTLERILLKYLKSSNGVTFDEKVRLFVNKKIRKAK